MNINQLDIKLINKSGIKKINNDMLFSINSMGSMDELNLPNIEECKDIYGGYFNTMNMKSLKRCGYIRSSIKILDLPELEYSEELDCAYTRTVYLPKLKNANGSLRFDTATVIYLYSLEKAFTLTCLNAKQLVIPKNFASYIEDEPYNFKINSDCDIVYTENYIKKESFSFKSYFMR